MSLTVINYHFLKTVILILTRIYYYLFFIHKIKYLNILFLKLRILIG